MGELEQKIADARTHASPRWTGPREEAVLAAFQRARGRRGAFRGVAVAALVCAVVALVVAVRSPPPIPPAASASAPSAIQLADGSTATPLGPSTRMSAHEGSTRIDVALDAGDARFEVTPRAARAFVVAAGDVTVTVLGTIFTVARGPRDVRVSVERGRVGVAWPGGDAVLAAGEAGTFPPSSPSPASASLSAATSASPSARAIPSAPARDETAELLLLADAARVSGRPGEAETALRRILAQHGGDPRAPLAAFALGRLYLDQLGRPRDAAAAFASARARGGPLAEDALAREVEAWARAGEPARAHARAEDYARLFPKSPRLTAVRKLGNLSDSD